MTFLFLYNAVFAHFPTIAHKFLPKRTVDLRSAEILAQKISLSAAKWAFLLMLCLFLQVHQSQAQVLPCASFPNWTATVPVNSPPYLFSASHNFNPFGGINYFTDLYLDKPWASLVSYSNNGFVLLLNTRGITPGQYCVNILGGQISIVPKNNDVTSPGDTEPCGANFDPTKGWFNLGSRVPPLNGPCEFATVPGNPVYPAFIGTVQVNIVSNTSVSLVDPVPDLVNSSGNAVMASSQLQGMLNSGRIVQGVGADGVTQLVIRIATNSPGDQFSVTLYNDQSPSTQSTSQNEDGALGNPGDVMFLNSQVTVTAGSAVPGGQAYAFAVYRAPTDFARPSGSGFRSGMCSGSSNPDNQLACRSVFIQVQDITTNTAPIKTPVVIVRAPVILLHGLWGNFSDWDTFTPLILSLFPTSPATLFTTYTTYNQTVGRKITASDPVYPGGTLIDVENNSLGFVWNAKTSWSQMKVHLNAFKRGANPTLLPVAAAQVDVVAHSMGGVVARTMPLVTGFLNDGYTFGQGYIHKLITIDSPHLGSPLATQLLSPQERGGCVQSLLAEQGYFSFNTVTMSGGTGTVSGALGDMVDQPLSPALTNIANQSLHPLPTSMIAGVYTNFNVLDSSLNIRARYVKNTCSSDPLAQRLTSVGWPGIFNGLQNDAVVSLPSQLNSSNPAPSPGNEFPGYVHSPGTEDLGFSGPSVLDSGSVPTQVIFLLNQPYTNSVYYSSINP